MAGKPPKRPRDPNQLAKLITDIATGGSVPEESLSDMAQRGRLGGKVGGPARAEKLTPDERRAVASGAAQARWSKRAPSQD